MGRHNFLLPQRYRVPGPRLLAGQMPLLSTQVHLHPLLSAARARQVQSGCLLQTLAFCIRSNTSFARKIPSSLWQRGLFSTTGSRHTMPWERVTPVTFSVSFSETCPAQIMCLAMSVAMVRSTLRERNAKALAVMNSAKLIFLCLPMHLQVSRRLPVIPAQ